jgi:ribosomal protein S18 acetylase RimI-like enzyme
MCPVRRLLPADVTAIAHRVADRLDVHAQRESLVSRRFHRIEFEQSLSNASDPTWVNDNNGRFAGHLFGAVIDEPRHGRQAYSGPDGWSFEFEEDLDALLDVASIDWRSSGVGAHVVWVPAGVEVEPWIARGYEVISVRGGLAIDKTTLPDLATYSDEALSVRRGSLEDFASVLAFEEMIDVAQGTDLEALSEAVRAQDEEGLRETLEDPETISYFLEKFGVAVAHCLTFPLPPLRGTHDNTVYLSDVAVEPASRGRGYGKYIVTMALHDAAAAGYHYAEVRWRVSNLKAQVLWSSFGFRPTYAQLRRTLD